MLPIIHVLLMMAGEIGVQLTHIFPFNQNGIHDTPLVYKEGWRDVWNQIPYRG